MTPKYVVIAPTYNNARTLRSVLAGVESQGYDIIVVNDGSTDDTSSILQGGLVTKVVTHSVNLGKAQALHSGFERAAVSGYTHAITIDTDGQHDPADIAALVEQSRAVPNAIVIGARPRCQGYPARSWWGRKISNSLVQLIGGVSVSDSQSGLRVYPLETVHRLESRTSRYAFETEVLVRSGWANVPVVETPIQCIYDVAAGRVSHFRTWRDSWNAAAMLAPLLLRSFSPRGAERLFPATDVTETGTLWERGVRWINPRRTLRMAARSAGERDRLAASVGWGAFMAFQPYFGVKTLMCVGLARAFKLQPLAVIGTSSLCTPPLGPVLWAMSIAVGHWVLRREAPNYDLNAGAVSLFREMALEWVTGGAILGILAGLGAYRWTRLIAERCLAAGEAEDLVSAMNEAG